MRFVGQLLLFSSTFAFSAVTVFMKLAMDQGMNPATAAFMRFFVGLVVVSPIALRTPKRLIPVRPKLILFRGLANSAAVLLLFSALSLTTVTKANLLNLTAPLFVFLLAPWINSERSPILYYLLLGVTLVGSYLVVLDGSALSIPLINVGDLLALLSAVASAFALSFLREARKHDESVVILFYMFLIGSVVTGAVALVGGSPVGPAAFLWALGGSSFAVVAQTLLTVGYRHVPASEGSLISASRIVIAAAFGILLFGDVVTPRIIAGGTLILGSLALVGVHGTQSELRGRGVEVGSPRG